MDINLVATIFAYCGYKCRGKIQSISRKFEVIPVSYQYINSFDAQDVQNFAFRLIGKLQEINYRKNYDLAMMKYNRYIKSRAKWFIKIYQKLHYRRVYRNRIHQYRQIITYCLKNPRCNIAFSHSYALQIFSVEGETALVELYLSIPNKYVSLSLPFQNAAQNNHLKIMEMLANDPRLRLDAIINEYFTLGTCALMKACESGAIDTTRFMINELKIDPGLYGYKAFKRAVEGGSPEIVKLLLADSRIDPTAQNNRVLQITYNSLKSAPTFNKHIKVLKILLADTRIMANLGAYERTLIEFGKNLPEQKLTNEFSPKSE